MTQSFRLAEVLGALSLATDNAVGNPSELALGATILSVRMGTALGLSREDLTLSYFSSITQFLGCTTTSREAGEMGLGSDSALHHGLLLCDWTDPDEVESTMEKVLPKDVPGSARAAALEVIRENHEGIPSFGALHCAQAMVLINRLPMPEGVSSVISHMYTRWDGKYFGRQGADSPLIFRIISLAAVFEVNRRVGGLSAAMEMALARAGGQFDPDLCAMLAENGPALTEGLDQSSLWDLYLESEPNPVQEAPSGSMVQIAETWADFADQKSGWFLGHSRNVAALAFLAADILGLSQEEKENVRLGALLHDIGRVAVSNGVLDKPGPLSEAEKWQVQTHSFHTERILMMTPAFRSVVDIAAAVHERSDGSGYHGRGKLVDPGAGIVAAADVYTAMTQERPWREALDDSEATREMLKMVSEGKMNGGIVKAVLSAAGHGKRVAEQAYPSGLTQREVEVLSLLAYGHTTKIIGERLGISPKTADHHIQNLYEKTGARGRAAAALFANEHGIFQK